MEGNQQKMREAMEEARDALIFYSGLRLPAHLNDVKVHDVLADIETALALPRRNCDVGTAEEQSDRFANFCDSHSGCSQCPVKSLWNFANGHKPSCGVLWAQMPYEEGESDGSK